MKSKILSVALVLAGLCSTALATQPGLIFGNLKSLHGPKYRRLNRPNQQFFFTENGSSITITPLHARDTILATLPKSRTGYPLFFMCEGFKLHHAVTPKKLKKPSSGLFSLFSGTKVKKIKNSTAIKIGTWETCQHHALVLDSTYFIKLIDNTIKICTWDGQELASLEVDLSSGWVSFMFDNEIALFHIT